MAKSRSDANASEGMAPLLAEKKRGSIDGTGRLSNSDDKSLKDRSEGGGGSAMARGLKRKKEKVRSRFALLSAYGKRGAPGIHAPQMLLCINESCSFKWWERDEQLRIAREGEQGGCEW
ncbi:uncharacterized protein G2W53_024610 [Senna tora]|uniref:Uncharacterized protein n=1 Tax=Senna tora TaxID=362788 RepID=A0A834WDA1_9FABA|nr:uncharacterized protein G2W53_024610 [Senna tora]